MKLRLILIFTFPSIFLLGQKNYPEKYNRLKYLAEEQIIFNNYSNALSYYKILKDSFYIWNDDLFNAMKCAIESKDISSQSDFIHEFIIRGSNPKTISTEFNLNRIYIDSFVHNTKGSTLLPKQSYSVEIRKSLIDMYNRDQSNRYTDSLMLSSDFLNAIQLNDLITTFGFISEKHLGYTTYSDSLDYNNMFLNLMTHQCRLFPYKYNIFLREQYLAGRICYWKFVYLLGFTESCVDDPLVCIEGPPSSNILIVDDLLFSCDENRKKLINNNRLRYYLETIDSEVGKYEYNHLRDTNWKFGAGKCTFKYDNSKYLKEDLLLDLHREGLAPID